MLRKLCSFLIIAFSLHSVALQAEPTDLGPAIGTKIPHTLAKNDQSGKARSFENLTGEKGAVLVFFRSAGWCPFCQKQLIDLQTQGVAEIEKRGYSVVGVSYDSEQVLLGFANRRQIKYPLLADTDSAIIKAFGVLNEQYKPGDRAYGIPHPIIVVTDSEGVIKAKLFKESYRERPEVEVVISTLDEISG